MAIEPAAAHLGSRMRLEAIHDWHFLGRLAIVLFMLWHIGCLIAAGFVIWASVDAMGSLASVDFPAVLYPLASALGDLALAWGGGAVAFGSMVWFGRRTVLIERRG